MKIVHEKVYDEVVERLKKAYSQVRIGDPLDSNTLYGPLHTKHSVNLYLKAVEEAKKQGGNVIIGGKVQNKTQNLHLFVNKYVYYLFFVVLNSKRKSKIWRAITWSRQL